MNREDILWLARNDARLGRMEHLDEIGPYAATLYVQEYQATCLRLAEQDRQGAWESR